MSYDGNPLTADDVDQIKQDLETAGITPPEFDSEGIRYFIERSGWAFRTFGGLSINLLALRVDATGMYNISDGSFGASVGVRIQL